MAKTVERVGVFLRGGGKVVGAVLGLYPPVNILDFHTVNIRWMWLARWILKLRVTICLLAANLQGGRGLVREQFLGAADLDRLTDD